MFFLTISFITSMLFTQAKHPITAMILIITQTSLMCLILFLNISMSWFSVMLFIIFMGGLMVLFVYMTSLASNEKFKISLKLFPMIVVSGLMFLSIFILSTETQIFIFNKMMINNFIFFIYSNNIIYPTLMLMTYLLLVLIISVNIIKMYNAPMRSMIN
uniref:NADH-ubiquinone oxidoreductase chain 6 n=1 Tax=Orthonychiurus folsomi TaxID=2581074 RepID=A0A650DRB8_9HEXA|nr:NADH dehydrogenase subunit 6 [Orthonychiurus folsomi]